MLNEIINIKKYLLTIKIQKIGENKVYTSNEIIEISPELWLAKKYREIDEGKSKTIIVIINCITIIEGNTIAMNKIGSSLYEIQEDL